MHLLSDVRHKQTQATLGSSPSIARVHLQCLFDLVVADRGLFRISGQVKCAACRACAADEGECIGEALFRRQALRFNLSLCGA